MLKLCLRGRKAYAELHRNTASIPTHTAGHWRRTALDCKTQVARGPRGHEDAGTISTRKDLKGHWEIKALHAPASPQLPLSKVPRNWWPADARCPPQIQMYLYLFACVKPPSGVSLRIPSSNTFPRPAKCCLCPGCCNNRVYSICPGVGLGWVEFDSHRSPRFNCRLPSA